MISASARLTSLLASPTVGTHNRGRHYQTVRGTMVDSVSAMILNVGEDGRIDKWVNAHVESGARGEELDISRK